jgi:hypothetical protein
MLGKQTINSKSLILRFVHFYEILQRYICHVGAVQFTTLIQPGQRFTFSGVAGWGPVDLYIVVRRIVDHNN